MGTSLGGPPESVVKALSKPNGKNVGKAVGELLNWADSQTDHALIQRSVGLMRVVIRTLKTALPETDPELIGGVCAHLFDLWETGQKLDKELQELTKLRFPQDRERLRRTLLWIEAIQLDMASFWIREVKKDLPKLLQALDKLERKSHPDKQKRKLAKTQPAGKQKVAQR